MTNPLEERHPSLMVPYVFTMGVVIYNNGDAFSFPNKQVRDAIIAALPPGFGVGEVTVTDHGIPNIAINKS